MKPRDYQLKGVNSVIKKISEGYKRIVFQLATGGGKTVCMSYLIHRYLLKFTDGKIVILVHRQELQHQTLKALSAFGVTNVKVVMIESFMNQVKKNGVMPYDMVIIDECHVGNFKKVFEHYEETIIIGFSATPISATKKHPLKADYQTIVCGIEINDLIASGNLSPCIHYTPDTGMDKSLIKKTAGEYNMASMAAEFSKPKLVDAVVDSYEKYSKGKKTLIFNTTIEHSILVHNCFKDKGYNSRTLDSNFTDEARKEVLQWFEDTEGAILNNVSILTAGFDCPSIEAVIFNRSTKSLPLWLQCCGRGARIKEGKEYFLLIDLGDNIQGEGHGYWNQKHDWEMYFLHPDKPGEGVAPTKNCPECDALIHMAVTLCPYCKHEMPREIVYSDMILELKILPDKPVKKNSSPALESAVNEVVRKIDKLNIPHLDKRELLRKSLVELYDSASWELKPHLLKHLLNKYAA